MSLLDTIGRSVAEGWWMFYDTLWALVLGFALSGAVQAFVSKAAMQRSLGDHRPATVAKASFFGMVSSSCSYAASALAKSLFARGALMENWQREGYPYGYFIAPDGLHHNDRGYRCVARALALAMLPGLAPEARHISSR